MKKLRIIMFASILLLTGSALLSYAQDSMMMEKANPKNPTVAIIRADWCGYCKQLEPTMMELMKEYNGKLNFVMFDVTNKETTPKRPQWQNRSV